MRTDFLNVFSVLKVTSGPRVRLAGRKSALKFPPVSKFIEVCRVQSE